MTRPHWKSLLLLVIWCLIGSLPQWGKWGSWIWLGVLILLAVIFCRRKSAVPALYFAESFPAGLFELELLRGRCGIYHGLGRTFQNHDT